MSTGFFSGEVPRVFVMVIYTGTLPEGSARMMTMVLESFTVKRLKPGQHYAILDSLQTHTVGTIIH